MSAALVALACGPGGPVLVERPEAPPEAVLFQNVSVLDVAAGRHVAGRDVLVRGERIAAIAVGGELAPPAGAQRIDGSGLTLVPGLVDSHGHLTSDSAPSWETRAADVDANLRAYLYCGVTTVLDPGDTSDDAVTRRDEIARGERLGPTVYTAGRLVTAPDGHPLPLVRAALPWWLRWYVESIAADPVGTPAEAEAVAAARDEQGTDFLKLVVDRIPETAPRMEVPVIEAAVRAAHARELRAIAHIGSVRDAFDTGRAGIDAWVHGVYKERIPDELIGELATFGIPMVPTLAVFTSYAQALRGPRAPTALERETVDAALLASFDAPPDDFPLRASFAPYLETLHRVQPEWADNTRRLHEAGVVLLAGSDTQSGVFPGAGLHRELALLHAAGLTNAEAIRAATLAPARFLCACDDPPFGEVAVGKRADLVLVEGDPLESLDALANIRAVMLRGVVLERRAVAAGS